MDGPFRHSKREPLEYEAKFKFCLKFGFTFITNRFIRDDRSVGSVRGHLHIGEVREGKYCSPSLWFLVCVPTYGYVQGGRTTAREAESQFYEFDPFTPAPPNIYPFCSGCVRMIESSVSTQMFLLLLLPFKNFWHIPSFI